MKKTSFLQKLTLASISAIVPIFSFQGNAEAFQIFFGEDLGLGEATRLPATPNSDAARASFLSELSGVGIEDFEDQTPGTTTPFDLTLPEVEISTC